MIYDFDFKSFSVDDFDFDFKIILRLIYDFKPSKSSFKSSDLASCITGSSTAVSAVTTVAESTSSRLIAGLEGGDDYGYIWREQFQFIGSCVVYKPSKVSK